VSLFSFPSELYALSRQNTGTVCGKIHFMKLLSVWMWESLENLPLLFGFVTAARLWEGNILAGLTVLIIGTGLGVLVTRFVEPKLHKAQYEVRWTSVLVNFVLFVALAIPFLYYFRADTRWISWKIDLLGGVAVGILLTYIQSLHWTGAKSRMLLHGAAMATSFPIIMLSLRWILRVQGWGMALALTFILVLFASFVIVLIDYREMYLQSGQSQ
jgi:hypothetical protein